MRLAVTLLAVVLGLIVTVAVLQLASEPVERRDAGADDAEAAAVQAGPPALEPDRGPDPADLDVTPIEGLAIRPAEAARDVALGEAHPDADYRMRLDLSRWGAAVRRIVLSRYAREVAEAERYVVHDALTPPIPNARPEGPANWTIYPYAARRITVNGETLSLADAAWELADEQHGPAASSATYTLTLTDGQGQPVLELRRRYVLEAERYGFNIEQSAANLTDQPLVIEWEQFAQGDLPLDPAAYLGDRRMYVTGYFHDSYDAGRLRIRTDDGFRWRSELLDGGPIWPHDATPAGADLAWVASENRYFAVITHPYVTDAMQATPQVPALEATFPRLGTWVLPDPARYPNADDGRAVVLTLGTGELALPAGESVDLNLGVFAGPRQSERFDAHPYSILHFDQLVRYQLGCAVCTFQWLARLLLGFLKLIHVVLADWGMAIIVLVICVRLLLHPITKRAQTNMMKMGKQMQSIQPEMEKLRKKYKDEPQKLNQEMMSLYREKGINPANMLGCLPMLLQAPIWIALYAMLYFAIELRHEPAFYGVFQGIGRLFGGSWPFLADLSVADHFIPLGLEFEITWLPFVNPSFAYLNILPFLMAIVMYINQKLTMPPAANEQAAQQQKIMRIVILIFPFILYSAPSGLTLYILASTFAGIVDSWIVRRHVAQMEEAGTLFERKARKPGGVMDRIAKTIEAKQKQVAEMQQGQARNKSAPAAGGKGKSKGNKGKGKRR